MTVKQSGRRALLSAYGLLVFVWLSPEDQHVWPPVLLGAGAGLLLALRVVPRPLEAPGWAIALFGALLGAGTSVAAVGLMFFKNALHAHVFLDFPPALLLALLSRAPGWALAGALAGCGAALLRRALRPHN